MVFISTVLTVPESERRRRRSDSYIGLLGNAKMFNVAITRAKVRVRVMGMGARKEDESCVDAWDPCEVGRLVGSVMYGRLQCDWLWFLVESVAMILYVVAL